MTTDSDRAAAFLAEVRERHRLVSAWGTERMSAVLASAADIPALAAALEAVLALHEPRPLRGYERVSWKPQRRPVLVCTSCRDDEGETTEWPCPEYEAISAALPGEEADCG